MIRQQKETVGLNSGAVAGGAKDGSRGSYIEPRDSRPTLADVGIDKKLSMRSQQLASMPEGLKFSRVGVDWSHPTPCRMSGATKC